MGNVIIGIQNNTAEIDIPIDHIHQTTANTHNMHNMPVLIIEISSFLIIIFPTLPLPTHNVFRFPRLLSVWSEYNRVDVIILPNVAKVYGKVLSYKFLKEKYFGV